MLALCEKTGKTIAQLMWENETVWRSETAIRAGLLRIWEIMQQCAARGCGTDNPSADDALPGPLRVRRPAPAWYRSLTHRTAHTLADPLSVMDWVSLYAIAV